MNFSDLLAGATLTGLPPEVAAEAAKRNRGLFCSGSFFA
jgi:hypothetical protein